MRTALNRQVVGSIPTASTIESSTYKLLFFSLRRIAFGPRGLRRFGLFSPNAQIDAVLPSSTASVREFTACMTLCSIVCTYTSPVVWILA